MSGALVFSGPNPILIEVVRSGLVESVSAVDVVIVDDADAVVGFAGDPHRVAFFRSALKPLQAAACMQEGWVPSGDDEVAVASASHSAEPEHLRAVRSILSAAGLDEDALRCPPALPLDPLVAAREGEPRRIFRDCSGKHAAFLATSVARGWETETYLLPDHPVQRAVLSYAERMGAATVTVGVDGCGAPTPAATLTHIAAAFGRGVAAAPEVARAMRAHPFLVAGTKRFDTDVMESAPGDLVVKSGAEGIVCFMSPSSRLSGALKARDGSGRPLAPASVWVLERLGLLSDRSPALSVHAAPPVLGGGLTQGELRVRL